VLESSSVNRVSARCLRFRSAGRISCVDRQKSCFSRNDALGSGYTASGRGQRMGRHLTATRNASARSSRSIRLRFGLRPSSTASCTTGPPRQRPFGLRVLQFPWPARCTAGDHLLHRNTSPCAVVPLRGFVRFRVPGALGSDRRNVSDRQGKGSSGKEGIHVLAFVAIPSEKL